MADLLIVEDEPDHQDILRDALCGQGHEVRIAGDVDAARAALAQRRPDLVVLDLHLREGASGYILLAILSADTGRRRIPVVACTGDPEDFELAQADARFSAVLAKPFAVTTLVETVGALVEGASAD